MYQSTAECHVMSYMLSAKDPPRFSFDFVQALLQIAQVFGSKDSVGKHIEKLWHRIFDEFGTHFPKRLTTGSRMTINRFMSSEESSDFKSKSYSEKRSVTAKVAFAQATESSGAFKKDIFLIRKISIQFQYN